MGTSSMADHHVDLLTDTQGTWTISRRAYTTVVQTSSVSAWLWNSRRVGLLSSEHGSSQARRRAPTWSSMGTQLFCNRGTCMQNTPHANRKLSTFYNRVHSRPFNLRSPLGSCP